MIDVESIFFFFQRVTTTEEEKNTKEENTREITQDPRTKVIKVEKVIYLQGKVTRTKVVRLK